MGDDLGARAGGVTGDRGANGAGFEAAVAMSSGTLLLAAFLKGPSGTAGAERTMPASLEPTPVAATARGWPWR